jgi:thioredoxin-dependent peroxiredoxin
MDQWIGKKLPELTLESTRGESIQIPEGLEGQWTVLYFYPKDDTPGCTKQACGYRDQMAQFKDAEIEVLGVSLDDLSSHQSFISMFELNFPLLVDADHQLSEALGVYGDQEWKGRVFKGLSRDSFLINPEGKVAAVWRKVNPEETVEETLAEAKKQSLKNI